MPNIFQKSSILIKKAIRFCVSGVWQSSRDNIWVRIIKTLNLSVTAFLDRGLQMKSAALTYSTVLALVPAIALLFAIGRGFGFQDLLSASLFNYFPAQHKALETAIGFVDSYLKEASNGIFVGVGIVILLWTLISLLSTIEQTFNNIWDIKKDRNIYQKFTDYIAICLIVPILMVCSTGFSIFVSTVVQSKVNIPFLSPFINVILEASPVILAWLAFAMAYYLIPNTKVHFKYAAISGAICAVAFGILQMLFVNGQIYVSKYNAIYGSFAFLPLLLIWMQLSFLILLFGCVLTYSMQNIFAFNYLGDVSSISTDYKRKIVLLVMGVIAKRFADGQSPLTRNTLSSLYDVPIRMVGDIAYTLHSAGLIYPVVLEDDENGFTPAVEVSSLTVAEVLRRVDAVGDTDFIPHFNEAYPDFSAEVDKWNEQVWQSLQNILITDLPIPSPVAIHNSIS